MIRDQVRAKYAYDCVKAVTNDQWEDYKVLVNSLGSTILRSGLATTMAFLERKLDPKKVSATELLFDHLAAADVPGLVSPDGDPGGAGLPAAVRALSLEDYILATREMLKVLSWFRRAVQARG